MLAVSPTSETYEPVTDKNMMTLSRIYRGVMGIKDAYLRRIGHYFRAKSILPEQTAVDRMIFKKVFQLYAGKSLRVFEWGMGYSTVFYSRYLDSIASDFEWHAIDNSREWHEKVALLVSRYRLNDRVHLYLSEFPGFWELPNWSWEERKIPKEVCSPEAIEYVEYARRVAEPKGFDVIIVDGRFRRRCLRVAAEVLAPGGLVLLHDAQKTHYHSSLEIYESGHFFNSSNVLGSKVKVRTWLGTLDHNRISDIVSISDSVKRTRQS